MNIQEMAEQCLKDSDEWFPNQSRQPDFLVLCLFGEVGELANEVKKVLRGTHRFDDQLPKIKEEATDVLIYLLNFMAIMGIDIEKEYNDKRQFNVSRFGHEG